MKKILIMLSVGVLMAGTANAQDVDKADRKGRGEHREHRAGMRERKNPEEMAARQTAMLDKLLDLSSKQERKVREITLKRTQETEALRSRSAAYREQKQARNAGVHQEMQAINDRWEAELKDILSKKQYTQYEANRQQMKNRRLAEKSEKGEKA